MTGSVALTRRPLFWATLAAIVTGVILQPVSEPDKYVASAAFGIALGATLAQVVGVSIIAVVLDRRFTSRPGLMALAFGWGGFAAISVAAATNTIWGDELSRAGLDSISAPLTAPVNEELGKLVGVLLVLTLLMPRRVGILQGVVIGFLVGAGFDIVENFGYAMDAALDAAAAGDDAVAAVITSLQDRLTNGTLLHALWTGVSGGGLAMLIGAPTAAGRRRGALWAAGSLFFVMAIHAAWDLPEISPASAVVVAVQTLLYVSTLGAFVGLWVAGRRRERTASRLGDTSRSGG